MTTQVLENGQFLEALKGLIESTKESGSVWITQKRLSYQDPSAMDTSDSSASSSHSCVVKATNGSSSLTTHIAPSLLPPFVESYNALLRASFAPHLRKRDKKKEKSRAEEAIKRTKVLESVVEKGAGLGSQGKRGSQGRSKRQRQIKSLKKAQIELGRIDKREESKKTAASASGDILPSS